MIYEPRYRPHPPGSGHGGAGLKAPATKKREGAVGMRTGVARTVAALAALALIATACGGDDDNGGTSGSGEEEMPTVKLSALSAGLTGVALTVIDEQNFDEANGFQGEFFFNDPDASGQFFLQRKSDIAFDSDPLTVAIARAEGLDVTTFYPVLNNNNCILVRSDSGYTSPEDLIGKKVGHFGADSGTTTSLSVMLQEFYGLDLLQEYDLIESDPATLVELLDKGEVEAIFDFVPHSSRAMVQTDAECLFGPAFQEWEEQRGGANFLSTISAYEDYLEENPETAEKVIAAWDDALAWINDNPEALQEEPYAGLMGQDDPEVLELISQQAIEFPLWTNDWSDEAQAAAEEFVDLSADQGILIDENPGGVVTSIEDWKE
jgi:NitT/TauT family transport system substrate-binding protein